MPARGYTSNADVASLMGRTFDAAQQALADRLIEAAELKVDELTGKSWKVNAQQSQYVFDGQGPILILPNVPIASIDQVYVTSEFGSTPYLAASTAYTIRDAARGVIFVNIPAHLVRIVYTAGNTIPANIKLGTEFLVIHWLRAGLLDELPGVQSASLGAEESLNYTDLVMVYGVPAEVYSALGVAPGGRFTFA